MDPHAGAGFIDAPTCNGWPDKPTNISSRLSQETYDLSLVSAPDVFAERVGTDAVQQCVETHIGPCTRPKFFAVLLTESSYESIAAFSADTPVFVSATFVQPCVALVAHHALRISKVAFTTTAQFSDGRLPTRRFAEMAQVSRVAKKSASPCSTRCSATVWQPRLQLGRDANHRPTRITPDEMSKALSFFMIDLPDSRYQIPKPACAPLSL